ncbi:MAG: glycosyl transferase family 4 [Cenarchaeum symbiont of Oopsacas minuta]|nr:glycosyl transferase family 4 [Cenarchaeum symbiont of Oopsacas minuta]
MDTSLIISTIVSCTIAFALVYIITPPLMRWLNHKKIQVPDAHVPGNIMVARPGGPAIVAGIVTGCIVLYVFLQQEWILAVAITTLAAFAVGLIDDLKRLGGWFKPLALAASATPLIIFGSYGPDLTVPLFGTIHIPILYSGVAILGVVLMGNTINSIDIFSGLASAFVAIASAALMISLLILGNYEVAAASAILTVSSIAYYRFHRIPCKIFPGDSGALALGVSYGSIAISGGVEIVAVIAMLPAVINSFLFLSGTKRIMEYKDVKKKSTALTDDFKMIATFEKGAVPSLVSIILARGKPMSETQLVRVILGLAVISACMAITTAVMMLVKAL